MENPMNEDSLKTIKTSEVIAKDLMIELELREASVMVAVGAIAFLIIGVAEAFASKSHADAFDKVTRRMSSTVIILKQISTFVFDIALKMKAEDDFESMTDSDFDDMFQGHDDDE